MKTKNSVQQHAGKVDVSIIVPAYNEKQSLPLLIKGLIKMLQENSICGEVIIVNDGSTDNTGKIAGDLSNKYEVVRHFDHRINRGKSAALKTGLKNSRGEVIVTIDADLQYTPEDVPKLLTLINNGYDVANGWRRSKQDPLTKKFFSFIYNAVSRRMFGLKVHDCNCGLRAFKCEVLKNIVLRRGHYVYFLAIAQHLGYRIGEVEVQHFHRQYGRTKFSHRSTSVIFDLIALKLHLVFSEKPIMLFGTTGALLLFIGTIINAYLAILKIFYGQPLTPRIPLLLLGVLFMMAGLLIFFYSFVAEEIASLRAQLEEVLRREVEQEA